MLSAYRIMWLLVMFDLPVLSKKERHQASKFRCFLQDEGFEMAQFSVYMRFCVGKEQFDSYVKKINKHLPDAGSIYILGFTDKQYENGIKFFGKKLNLKQKNPDQLTLF